MRYLIIGGTGVIGNKIVQHLLLKKEDVMFTFWFLAMSQLAYLFVSVSLHLYALAEILQLIGFLLLLFTMLGIFRKTRK